MQHAPAFDEQKARERYQLTYDRRMDAQKAMLDKNARWWTWYDAYLKSKVWEHKRRLYQAYAGHLRSLRAGAGAAGAPSHVPARRREPLFDLVAVCKTCHEQLA